MNELRRRARWEEDVARRLKALESTPQLGHSSIEGGAIDVHDEEGSLRAVVGALPDASVGVIVVNGPPPPAPSMPTCTPAPRGYVVTWDGRNEDGTDVQPLDWSRIEIHSSVASGFEPTPNTLRATFETTQGGTVTIAAGLEYEPGLTDTYEVCLVARNTSGTASAPSGRATVTVGKVENQDIADFAVDVKKLQSTQHFLY